MSFKFAKAFEPFIEKCPIAVMARGVTENLLNSERIDGLFEQTAETQYTRNLVFSSLVDLFSQVVLGVEPSVHAAYQKQAETLGVSIQAIYDKLNHVETRVSAELVHDSARQASEIIEALGAKQPPLLEGYRTKILDGNHFSATEHRIKELRTTWEAPLPGKILVVLDQELMVATNVFPCEDGHAQERSLIKDVIACMRRGELWIADRNFCTIELMQGARARETRYLVRQHGTLKGTLVGERQYKGNTATGEVFEQKLRITASDQTTFTTRRITVELNEPTRDGDKEIHLLTDLPVRDASATTVAGLYAKRWTIETLFQEVTETLTCEVKPLGYPKAALFGFCLALMAYHVVSVIKAALRSVHGREKIDREVSGYYLSLEISQTYPGMMIAIPPRRWKGFLSLTPREMARVLKDLARHANLRLYRKHPRGPKKPPPKRSKYKNGRHVSTAKLLATRK